ncbi:DUF6056 family protein [Helicobacter sp. 23-1045]
MRHFIHPTLAIFLALFAFLLFINALLPLQSDDFNHYFSALNGFASAKSSYLHWNGRIGELLFTAFIARINPYLFDFLNALVGMIFIGAFFILLFCRAPRDFRDISLICLTMLILLHFSAFGSNFAWGSGALNYLWGLCFIMLFLLPYRFIVTSKIAIRGGAERVLR